MYLPLTRKKSFLEDLTLALSFGLVIAGASYVAYQIFRPTEAPTYNPSANAVKANDLEKKLEKVETILPKGTITVGEIEDYSIDGINYSIQTGIDYDNREPFIKISATSSWPNQFKTVKVPLKNDLTLRLNKWLVFRVTGFEEKESSQAAPIGYGDQNYPTEKETQIRFEFLRNS